MSEFWKRALSGLLFVGILTGCIFIHPVCFYILFLFVNGYTLLEFGRMVRRGNVNINIPLCLLCGILMFTSGFLHNYCGYRGGYIFFFLFTFAIPIAELYRKKGNGLKNIVFTYYSLFYISLPFTLLIFFPYIIADRWMPEVIFLPFLLVWVNDTFAYLFGVSFGKHKLFPRISPKKSWEGAIGGSVMTLVAGLAVAPFIEGLSVIDTTIISCIVMVFAIYGDLIESMFKRTLEVKDSGHFLPGHGGILDRFDAILFTLPAIFVYLEFMY